MKSFMIVKMVSGVPDIGFSTSTSAPRPYKGYSLAANLPGQWGLYLFSGTKAQLDAIAVLANVTGLCSLTEPKFNDWPELNGTVNATVRTQLNTWLTNYSMPNIPANWTYKQIFDGWVTLYNNNSPALADVISGAFRTQMNVWLTARDLPNIPAAWTYRQVMQAIQERLKRRWSELDDVVDPAVRTKLNTWLTARGYPNIPAGWTYRQLLEAVYQRMNQPFNLGGVDIVDV